MTLQFTGKISEVRTPRTGTSPKGEWASVEFEVTELNPQNPDYPQIGLFDMFKNGDYVKYAKDFEQYYPVNTPVTVEFNLKKNEYTNKEGALVGFYKTSAWKVEKIQETETSQPTESIQAEVVSDDLPF